MNNKIKKINIRSHSHFFLKKTFNMLCPYKFFLLKYIISVQNFHNTINIMQNKNRNI